MWSQERYVMSLCITCLICKMGVINIPTTKATVRSKWNNLWKPQNSPKLLINIICYVGMYGNIDGAGRVDADPGYPPCLTYCDLRVSELGSAHVSCEGPESEYLMLCTCYVTCSSPLCRLVLHTTDRGCILLDVCGHWELNFISFSCLFFWFLFSPTFKKEWFFYSLSLQAVKKR